MHKRVRQSGLWLFAIGWLLACNGQPNQTNKSAETPSSPAQSTPPAEKPTETNSVVSQPVAPTDSSGQNYTFDTNKEGLHIVGEENQYDIILPTDVLFDFDKSTLRTEGLTLLGQVRQHFATHQANQIHVWGHTDSKGSDQYNAVLSQKRAVAVANWLKKNIKTKGLVMAIGRGEQEPLVPNQNPDGSDNPVNRQKNRRVTLSVVKYPDAGEMMDKARKTATP
jgi:outer membrane protein OmpA-like peptidoglycan-associated protein